MNPDWKDVVPLVPTEAHDELIATLFLSAAGLIDGHEFLRRTALVVNGAYLAGWKQIK